jgi:hypothetical protein
MQLAAAPKAVAAFTRVRPAVRPASVRVARPQVTCMASSMQFIKGIDEPTIPEVKLTRSRDGSSGTGASRRLAQRSPPPHQHYGRICDSTDARLPAFGASCHAVGTPAASLLPHPPSPTFPPTCAATFIFQNPAIFEASSELGDITGLYMTDDEGTIQVGAGWV